MLARSPIHSLHRKLNRMLLLSSLCLSVAGSSYGCGEPGNEEALEEESSVEEGLSSQEGEPESEEIAKSGTVYYFSSLAIRLRSYELRGWHTFTFRFGSWKGADHNVQVLAGSNSFYKVPGIGDEGPSSNRLYVAHRIPKRHGWASNFYPHCNGSEQLEARVPVRNGSSRFNTFFLDIRYKCTGSSTRPWLWWPLRN